MSSWRSPNHPSPDIPEGAYNRGHPFEPGLYLDVTRNPRQLNQQTLNWCVEQLRLMMLEMHLNGNEHVHVNAMIATKPIPHMAWPGCGCKL